MRAHRDKAPTTLALLVVALGVIGCVAADKPGLGRSLAVEREELQRTFGSGVEVEQGEALRAALAHNERFSALYETFSESLAKTAGVEDPPPLSFWELHPGILYAALVLVQAAINGEVACEERRQCELVKAGLLQPTDDQAAPCRWAQPCDRQHLETLSTCNAILATRCRFPAGALCQKYRQAAYNLCRDVADCQLACCAGACSGANCAAWATNGRTGEKCSNCATGLP